MADKILHAVYDDDDKLMDAVKDLKASNFSIDEVYTPFPVHGFHVLMGGIMLSIMLIRSVRYSHFEQHDHFGFEAASWYWHFVDVVWVMLFLFVYIL